MQHEVKINEELTKARFGYSAEEVTQGSRKMIVVECPNCHATISRRKRDVFRTHQCPVVVGNQKRCHRCTRWKDISLFNKSGRPSVGGGVAKMCRECYNTHPAVKKSEKARLKRKQNAFVNDFEYWMVGRKNYLRSSTKSRSIPFDLDLEFMLDLWRKQGGKCYYTDLPMIAGRDEKTQFQRWDAPSLDRKDPDKGYMKGNVVWCIFGVNAFKNSLTEEQFLERLREIRWRKS